MELILGGASSSVHDIYLWYVHNSYQSNSLIGFVGKLNKETNKLIDVAEVHEFAVPTPDGGVGILYNIVIIGEEIELAKTSLCKLEERSPIYKKYKKVTSVIETAPSGLKL
jgi:hypothetical protein